MKQVFIIGILSVMLFVAGCATQPAPPVTEYALAPALDTARPAKVNRPFAIKVAPIEASRIYQTSDFYYVDAGYQHNPYAYSRWVDAPVRMLQLVLQDRLEQSGLFKAVLPSSSMLPAELRLEITLYDFSHHLGEAGASEGVVRLQVYLVDIKKGRLLASQQFAARVPATGKSAAGGVSAINAAVSDILSRLIDWLDSTAAAR